MLMRLQASQTKGPAAMRAAIDKGVEPQQASKVWILLADAREPIMGNSGQSAGRNSDDAVIHWLHDQAMQVDEVSRHVERCYLPLAFAC
jgi:hypothetical protein